MVGAMDAMIETMGSYVYSNYTEVSQIHNEILLFKNATKAHLYNSEVSILLIKGALYSGWLQLQCTTL